MIKIKNSLLLILVFSFLITYSQKRGVAYGHHSPNDMKALSPEISWWYNWSISLKYQAYLCFQNLKEHLSKVFDNFGKL